MTSSTEERTVPESRSETLVRTETRESTGASVWEHFREYGHERPGVMALWCFGIGFVLGWKFKLW